MIAVLMRSAKLTTSVFLETKILWNKSYDVIIFVYDITKETLPGDCNYSIDVVMWTKFGNSSIVMNEAIVTSTL